MAETGGWGEGGVITLWWEAAQVDPRALQRMSISASVECGFDRFERHPDQVGHAIRQPELGGRSNGEPLFGRRVETWELGYY